MKCNDDDSAEWEFCGEGEASRRSYNDCKCLRSDKDKRYVRVYYTICCGLQLVIVHDEATQFLRPTVLYVFQALHTVGW